jgi:hypothetical protein
MLCSYPLYSPFPQFIILFQLIKCGWAVPNFRFCGCIRSAATLIYFNFEANFSPSAEVILITCFNKFLNCKILLMGSVLSRGQVDRKYKHTHPRKVFIMALITSPHPNVFYLLLLMFQCFCKHEHPNVYK